MLLSFIIQRPITHREADPFISGAGGFTTAKGKAIAPPSAAAVERAKRLLASVDEDVAVSDDNMGHPSATGIGGSSTKRQRIDDVNEENYRYDDDPAPEFTMSQSTGFVTGKGKAVPPPSRAAMHKAMKLMSAVEEEEQASLAPVSQATPTAPSRFLPGSSLASGNAIAGPSRSVNVDSQAQGLASHIGRGGSNLSGPHSDHTPRIPVGGMDEARRRALAIFGEDDASSSRNASTTMLPPMSSTPFRPLLAGSSSTPRALPLPSPTIGRPAAFRTPLRATTNTFSQPHASPLRQSQQRPTVSTPKAMLKPIEIKKTPATTRRVGLGLTPSSRGRVKRTFTTPFMKGPQANGSPLKTAITPRTSFLPASALAQQKKEPVVHVPVFDLTSESSSAPNERCADSTVSGGRKNVKDAFLHPQFHATEELKEMGLYV